MATYDPNQNPSNNPNKYSTYAGVDLGGEISGFNAKDVKYVVTSSGVSQRTSKWDLISMGISGGGGGVSINTPAGAGAIGIGFNGSGQSLTQTPVLDPRKQWREIFRKVDMNKLILEVSLENLDFGTVETSTYSLVGGFYYPEHYRDSSMALNIHMENPDEFRIRVGLTEKSQDTCDSEITSVKKPEDYIWGAGDAGSVEKMGTAKEVLKSIISLAESQRVPLTLPLYVESVTGEWYTMKVNIEHLSSKPSGISETEDTNPKQKTGTLLGRITDKFKDKN